ncbi:MAG: phosphoribosylamine--glycine ligase, partial [Firmicutes bacterium]|nr:phosphoribosylamine--glycine ligase [Bacillota bacterium]
MKVLVVGNGGREHAIIWKLKQSPLVDEIYCAAGNAGIGLDAKLVPIQPMEIEKMADFAEENKIDFTVIGMDDPLAAGIVDVFEGRGLKVFGPRKNAAVIEASKVFSKNLMKKYGIPTGAYEVFSDYDSAYKYCETSKYPLVVKADGLALGKGVLICETFEDAKDALTEIMLDKKFGDSGNNVVIEEFLTGPEVSVLSFCDGKTVKPMVSAQDHKRAMDNDKGLNTGGMGTFSPGRIYTDELAAEC